MDTSAPVFYAAGLPALISTGITCIYLILKVISYLFHAISHKTEGRVATAMPGCRQHQHSPDSGEKGDPKICTQVSGRSRSRSNMDTSAPVFYAAGLRALISTGITCIYLILKVISYLFHAISHKTEGRVATATPGCRQHQHSPDSGEKGDPKICTQVSGRSRSRSNMDTSAPVFYAAGLRALISTGITCIYLILKVISYLFHAISHKTEGRVATATLGCRQHQHSPDSGEKGDPKICTQVSGCFSEQYGGVTQ